MTPSKPKSIALSDWQLAGLARGAVSMVVVPVKPQPILQYRAELYRAVVDEFGCCRWYYDDIADGPNRIAEAAGGVTSDGRPINFITGPLGRVGDVVAVKERFQFWTEFNDTPTRDVPESAGINFPDDGNVWDARIRPARSMPLNCARYRLRLESVGVKRVCEITEAEASKSGIELTGTMPACWTEQGRAMLATFKHRYIEQHGSASFASDWAFFCGVEVSR